MISISDIYLIGNICARSQGNIRNNFLEFFVFFSIVMELISLDHLISVSRTNEAMKLFTLMIFQYFLNWFRLKYSQEAVQRSLGLQVFILPSN